METTTKKLAIVLVVLLAAAGAFYIYQHYKAEKVVPPKLGITVGAPIARGSVAAARPAPSAPAPKKPGTAAARPDMRQGAGPEKTFTYSSLGKRDPFMSPLEVPKLYPPVSANARPIERVPAESLVLKAIIWNEKGYRALVVTPDGRGYTVKVGDAIGNKQGRIVKISEKRVYVTERVRDILGNVEANNIVLQLHTKEAD